MEARNALAERDQLYADRQAIFRDPERQRERRVPCGAAAERGSVLARHASMRNASVVVLKEAL
jgi:hypothetical protein